MLLVVTECPSKEFCIVLCITSIIRLNNANTKQIPNPTNRAKGSVWLRQRIRLEDWAKENIALNP